LVKKKSSRARRTKRASKSKISSAATTIKSLKAQITQLKRQAYVAERLRFESATGANRERANVDSSVLPSTFVILAAGVAHEFNNILGAVDGHAEWALDSGSNSEMKEALEIARVACARSSQITKSLQKFAQPKEEALKLLLVNGLIDEALLLLSGELKLEGIRVNRDLSASRAVNVYVDPSRVIEVLVNLLHNARDALKSSGQKDPQIVINAAVDESHLWIAIEDNGTGVADSLKGLIFQPFFTTKGVLKEISPGVNRAFNPDQKGGSGLGLFLSRNIMEELGGTLTLESPRQLSGARFVLKFPIAA
jgi:signal transduction histidine kinase